MSEIHWDANRGVFTRRQCERFAYEVIVRMVARMEYVESRAQGGSAEQRAVARKEREDSELALADLIGQVPAHPSLSTVEGLAIVDLIKADIEKRRQAERRERLRKLKATDPLAVGAGQHGSGLQEYAMVILRKTQQQRTMRLPHRSS